jgi:FKBP-type peptidyl-prolyl cis-trans isomerase SlyD
MSEEKNPKEIQKNTVVTLDYTLKVNDQVVDSTQDHEPIQFIQGHGQIISGLEDELYGMTPGQKKELVIEPSKGYGESDPDAFADIPRKEFPGNIPLKRGVELRLTDEDGEEMYAVIDSLQEDSVRLNFNHPLAGEDLHFNIEVVDIRPATSEEIQHGHVHEHGGSHQDQG